MAAKVQAAHPAVWATVNRYDNAWIAQHVQVDDTCTYSDPGTAKITVNPKYGPASTGVRPCTLPADFPVCPGVTVPACAAIYYQRTAHNNKSIRQDTAGAIDVFTYNWQTYDHTVNVTNSPDIAVKVVRPIGETNEFQGFVLGSGEGKWLPALTPPTDDTSFDFSGETVREVHTDRRPGCQARAEGTTGNPGDAGSVPNTYESGWTIVAGNKFNRVDAVGWQPCTIQFYRCTKTIAPCEYTVIQDMRIHSPADADDAYTTYTTNILHGGIDPYLGPFFNNGSFMGAVYSIRAPDGNSGKQWHFIKTDRNSCSGYPNAKFSC